MKKRFLSLTLVLALILAFIPVTATAATPQQQLAAETLNGYGLFQGTGTDSAGNPIFALDDQADRAQGVVMLVRLLGAEDEARQANYPHPFTDVPSWASPHVGYAYRNGLTTGISATEFGSQDRITATQYLTFVLRALGYVSGKDFLWNAAWELSDELNITNGEYSAANNSVIRGGMALISLNTLSATNQNTGNTLFDDLVAAGAIREDGGEGSGGSDIDIKVPPIKPEERAVMEYIRSEANEIVKLAGFSPLPSTVVFDDFARLYAQIFIENSAPDSVYRLPSALDLGIINETFSWGTCTDDHPDNLFLPFEMFIGNINRVNDDLIADGYPPITHLAVGVILDEKNSTQDYNAFMIVVMMLVSGD